MSRPTLERWMTLPALLLAAFVWTGVARAQAPPPAPDDDDEFAIEWAGDDVDEFDLGDDAGLVAGGDDRFNGPGGLSGPAEPRGEKGGGGERRIHRTIVKGGHGGPGMMRGDMGGMRGMRGMHGRGRMGAMGAMLNLTDRQKEQMADLHEAQARRMITIRAGLAETRLDLRKQMRADTPNKAQIDATIDRMAKLRADAQKARVGTMLEAHGLLTPEQRKSMKEMHGRMGGGMHGGMPGHEGGPHGGGDE